MADRKEPPAEDGVDKAADGEARAKTRRFGDSRRRLPLAALAVLLALVGVGIYFAWPSIQDSVQTSPDPVPNQVAEVEPAVEPTPAVPAAAPQPFPAFEALSAEVAALQRALAERDAAPPPPAPDLTPIHDAMARLEELEQRLNEAPPPAAVAQSAAPAVASPDAAAAMDFTTIERLDSLEAALKARGGGAEIEDLRAGQTELRQQVAALRQLFETIGGREAESGQAMVLVLSLSRLSRAAATAQPFAREIEALRTAAEADGAAGLALENAIRELAAHALGGTETAAGLSAAFDDVALAVIHADADADDQGWVDATIGRLRRIVTVRRVGGDIAADSLEGRLSALHRALAGGDLAAAIALAEALPAKARSGAEAWLADARARLAVERALAVLDGEISARVAARWATGGQTDK